MAPKAIETRLTGRAMDDRTQLSAEATVKESGLINSLKNRIRRLETAGRQGSDETISMGSPAIDSLLPNHGLPQGIICEWFAESHGCGSEIFSLITARSATTQGGALVIIDSGRTFYAPAAAAWGIDLSNTIVIRETNLNNTLWAIDQCLRSPSVAAVWGELPDVDERWLRRFQLSAEETGTLGLFNKPKHLRHLPSWAEIQWLVEPQANQCLEPKANGNRNNANSVYQQSLDYKQTIDREQATDRQNRFFKLHLLRCRGGRSGKSASLQIDMQTGQIKRHTTTSRTQPHERITKPKTHPLRLVPGMADPTPGHRTARA